MKSLNALATEIKQRRQLLKISQDDLAQISGVSLRSLKALERGKANPTWNQLSKILSTLGWEINVREKAMSISVQPGVQPSVRLGDEAGS